MIYEKELVFYGLFSVYLVFWKCLIPDEFEGLTFSDVMYICI
jgi:hypothetical protein